MRSEESNAVRGKASSHAASPDPRRGYRELRKMLAQARAHLVRRVLAQGALRALDTMIVALAATILILVVRPGGWGPPIAVGVLGLVAAYAIVRHLIVPYFRVPSLASYVRAIDEYFKQTAGDANEFLNALELGSQPVRVGTSAALVEALIRDRVRAATGLDLDAPGRQPIGRSWKVAPAAALGLLLVLLLATPARFADSVRALMRPSLPEPAVILVESLTGDVSVERGQSVTVTAGVRGSHEEATIEVRRGAGVWRAFTMATVAGDGGRTASRMRFTARQDVPEGIALHDFTIPAIDQETHYRVSVDEVSTVDHRIRVIEPLRINGFQLTYHYPEYTGLASETVDARDGSVSALPGTRIEIDIATNEPIDDATLEVADGAIEAFTLSGDRVARATLRVEDEGSYTIHLRRRPVAGYTENDADVFGPYSITPTPDREPLVALLEPAGDMDVPRDMIVRLTVHATDDYGLSSLYLRYSYEGADPVRRRLSRFTGYPREATETYTWSLGDLNLLPGDLVTYYLTVYDNDSISGPKQARTRTYTLRFPTMAELYAEVEEVHEQGEMDVADVLDRSMELQETLEEMAREMKKFPEPTWEDRQEMQSAFEKQQELRERVADIAESLGEALDRLDNQELVNEEVLEKLSQIQDLMEQITDPELQEAMRKLGESLAQLDQNEIQQAMNNLELSQEELLRNLEKTLELLRQIQIEEKMERAVEQVQEMLEKQEGINDELEKLDDEAQTDEDEEDGDLAENRGDEDEADDAEGNESEGDESKSDDNQADAGEQDSEEQTGDSSEEQQQATSSEQDEEQLMQLAEREEETIEDAEELRELLEELAEALADQQQQVAEELDRLAEQAASKQPMQSSMQQAMQQMMQGNPKGAQESGENAADQMRAMLSSLQMQQQMMMNMQALEAAEKLRKAAQDLLWISHNEEDLLVQDRDRRNDILAERQQRLLEGTQKINEIVEEVARTSMMVGTEFAGVLGQPLRSMENATRSYERGNRAAGRLHGYQALAQVNESILKLLEQQQSMCQGSCGSAKQTMERMMQLGQQQMQVNEGTRQMQGKRLSEGDRQRLARLAAQQRAIQKGLEEVAQTLDQRRDVLGRMGDLAGEMEEVAEEMERRHVDERIVKKQQQFLARLLDAQRSIRKRDVGRERRSETGRQVASQRPAALPAELLSTREQLEADILRGRSDVYPPGYRELVERYFRALAQQDSDR